MKQIPLTQGFFALVDDEDYDKLSLYKWGVLKGNRGILYASRNVSVEDAGKKGVLRLMHQDITGCELTDHKDINGLNNQKVNLRSVTKNLNAANARKRLNTTSQYKGVSWDSSRNRWILQIKYIDVRITKRFLTEIDAALAYDFHARKLFGDYAKCNFGPGELL